ncbi:MAG: hypothetical protein KGH75_00575 [Rhodospirillales bacterium]|nr:hypothetical protein [Rhodospirillales bacterium]
MRCAGARLAAYGRLETQYAHALTLLARAYRMLTKPEGYREIGALADEIQHAL